MSSELEKLIKKANAAHWAWLEADERYDEMKRGKFSKTILAKAKAEVADLNKKALACARKAELVEDAAAEAEAEAAAEPQRVKTARLNVQEAANWLAFVTQDNRPRQAEIIAAKEELALRTKKLNTALRDVKRQSLTTASF